MPQIANDVFMRRLSPPPPLPSSSKFGQQVRAASSGSKFRRRAPRSAPEHDLKHFIKHDGTKSKHPPVKGKRVMIWAESPVMDSNTTRHVSRGKFRMPRPKKDNKQAKKPSLANHYRAIGPAAIVAALLHTEKKKKPVQKFISPRVA
ncbi:MAG TPA: hypothetical protein PKD01_07350 [Mesorhizobium sp.]|nr:hypothetical protein [Mesorhizobium sp.]